MFFTSLFIGVCLIFGALGQSQVCVSDPVKNLTVTSGAVLNWTAPINCNVSFYVVHIIGEDNITYHYEATNTTFNISFLPLCELYEFRVTPISELNVQGGAVSIHYKALPNMAAENLTVSVFNITASNRHHAFLEWELPDEVQRCIDLYRIVIWDEDGNIPHDVYVEDNHFNFSDAVPCMHYEFGVRPIYDPEEDGPLTLFNFTYPGARSTPPILSSITEGVTSINMTWILESYQENRCTVTAINIDATPNFNVSHPVIDDSRRLPVAFELLNLRPNTVYIGRVSVVNSVGLSDPVILPLQTLPNDILLN